MYVNVNGKIVNLTTEEYEALIENQSIPAKGPASKMDELIASVNSVAAAISEGGGDTPTPTPSVTYTLTKEGSTIKLEGTDNSVSSVSDDNTTYNFSIEDRTITLAGSDNTVQTVEIPEESTAILSQSWDTENREYGLTVTDNDTESKVQIQYHLVKDVEANQVVLKAGDREVDRIQLAQDQDTKYRLEKVDNELRLIPSDGSEAIVVTLDDDLNTLYTISFDPETDELKLQANDDSLPQIISLSKYASADWVSEELDKKAGKEETEEALAGKADKSEIPSIEGLAEKTYVDTELTKKADATALDSLATKTELNDGLATKADKSDIPSIEGLATTQYVDTELAKKVDTTALNEYATIEAVNTALESKADKTALDSYATTEAMNTALETKAEKSDIPDISNLVTTEAMHTALETKSDKSDLNDYATTESVNTELAKKADTTALEPLATKAELEPLATTEALNTGLATKLDKNEIIKNGVFDTSVTTNGFTSRILNERDGGGSFTTDNSNNINSFVGVNQDTKDGVCVQIYSKFAANKGEEVANYGARLAANPNGLFYTSGKTNGSFEANDELATKKDLPNMENYATTEDVDAVSSWATEELSSQNAALKAQIEMLNKIIRDIKYPEIENMDVDMDISASGKDIEVSGTVSNAVRNITNASSVIAEDIALENARMAISATEDVEISGMSTSGTLAKDTSNAAMSINNSGNVVIKDSTVAQNSYNAIEIGLTADSIVKNVLIDNIHFSGNLTNNAISIFAHAENAEIVISNCLFEKCSNPIRISNRTNVPAKIRFINCRCNSWDSNADYAGFVLFQDYTSSSAADAEAANRFANLEVTFENCYGPDNTKIVGDAETLSNPEHQVLYVYLDRGGKLAYDAARFPKVNAF